MDKKIVLPLIIIGVGILIVGVFWLGRNSNDSSLGVNTTQANLRKVDLEIDNMFCLGCRSSVVNSVRSLPGVVQADADTKTDSGWVIYDPAITSKEQIVAASVFNAYPSRILDDQVYRGEAGQGQETQEIPPEIEQKLNELAGLLLERGIVIESFFQQEIDDAITRGFWDKANDLLDNYLQVYE